MQKKWQSVYLNRIFGIMENQKNTLYSSIWLPLIFIILIWAVEVFQYTTNVNFSWLGIFPRTAAGLKGIIAAPLIHGDFSHLISNSLPLFVLSSIIMYFYRKVAIPSFAMIYLLTGISVWLFARPVYHIGASGVVYGLVAFIFWNGVFQRNIMSIALALLVTFVYGGMLWGVVPGKEGVSWESHLFGAISGIATAYLFKETLDLERTKDVEEVEEEGKEFFFNPDTFNQKKSEKEEPANWISTKTWDD